MILMIVRYPVGRQNGLPFEQSIKGSVAAVPEAVGVLIFCRMRFCIR